MTRSLRLARAADGPAMAAIYAPLVRDGAVSFEAEPPSGEEMAGRVAACLGRTPWLVCEEDGAVIGYAYAGPYRTRAAYAWTAEVSVYVRDDARGRHVGQALYAALLAALRALGYRTAVAAIARPNPPSVALHERCGFEHGGVLEAVGFKNGRWHDVGFWVRRLDESPPAAEPQPLGAIVGTPAWSQVLAAGAEVLAHEP